MALGASARADDRGFTFGGTAAAGYDSRGGGRAMIDLAIGSRHATWEWTFEPRLVLARFRSQGAPAGEFAALVRFFVDTTYGEISGGLALLPSTGGGDFVALPDAQPFLGLGLGQQIVRSESWVLDARAVYTLEVGVQNIDPAPKSNIHSVVIGPAFRFY